MTLNVDIVSIALPPREKRSDLLTWLRYFEGTSTRARLAELDALKARLSTLPVSPAPASTSVLATTVAPAQDQTAPLPLSPRDTESWNEFLNWTEPQTISTAPLGASTRIIPRQSAVREQHFPTQLATDDASGWHFPPDTISTSNDTLHDDPATDITPRIRRGSQSVWTAHQGPHSGPQPRGPSRSPLHLAAMEGNAACVRALLRHKADVNSMSMHGVTALHVCAEHGNSSGHVAVVRILVEYGAEVDARDDNGATPLQIAAANGNDRVLDILATLGADVNAT